MLIHSLTAGDRNIGHRYTGPYNDLENQVRYNPETGEILEIYDPPTGKTDAVAMQHDVDYSVCGDNKKCKHKADRKMVKSLDAVLYSTANDPQPQMIPRPQVIPKVDRK